MSATYVALDLETTGLDPDRDEIIEVGAVRFSSAGVEDTFHTLVNPRRPLPYRIRLLTGIGPEELEGAPFFAEVASELDAFLGADAVVGQNVAFDLGFLARQGVVPHGPVFDTFELASILLPELTEHSLGFVARYLGVDVSVAHRALNDAITAQGVFLALRARLAALPPEVLAEAERIAATSDWPLRHLLREVAAEGREPLPPPWAGEELVHGVVRRPRDPGPPLTPAARARPVEPEEAVAILETARRRPGIIEGYEERPEQVRMAGAVAEALSQGEDFIVEAGTGVGKSLAYLIPAACYAVRNGARVIVSTNTINLQEQLMGQDILIVRRLLEGWSADEEPFDPARLVVAQLKGRRNYLCLLRWAAMQRSAALSAEEARLLVRLLLWLPRSDTGDRSELNLTPAEEPVWQRLSAQNETCLAAPCPYVRDGSCFLLRGRRRAEAAHLLIVNHALLLSDVAAGGNVLPHYAHLVVDEAQHLEDEATEQFGFHAGEGDLAALLDRIHERLVPTREGGLVASIRSAVRGLASRTDAGRRALDGAAALAEATERVRGRLPDLFARLAEFLRQQAGDEGDYDQRLLLNRAMRVQPDWAQVEAAWEGVDLGLGDVLGVLAAVQQALAEPEAGAFLDQERLLAETGDLLQAGEGLRRGLAAIVAEDDPQTISWLTSSRLSGAIILSSAPLLVAEALQARLFGPRESSILTSATLSTEGHFNYIRQRLGLAEARELLLGSPFDYARSTVVLIPQDMPEPNQVGYAAALQEALVELCRESEGRALVLFTSHAALRAAYHGVKAPLEEEGILVQGHAIDGTPRHLLRVLRENPRTAVLGTASFWEGVDVVGEALSLLVMTRLPFSVPTDPVFRARSDLFDDPFTQYALPQAVLRFKQGFGRLIRRKTDRGAMVVLDRRIRSKGYGEAFLRSLPACTVREAPLRDLPRLAAKWLRSEGVE